MTRRWVASSVAALNDQLGSLFVWRRAGETGLDGEEKEKGSLGAS